MRLLGTALLCLLLAGLHALPLRSLAQEPEPNAPPATDSATDASRPTHESGESPESSAEGADAAPDASGPETTGPGANLDESRVPRTSCHGRRVSEITVQGNRRVAAEDILTTMQLRQGEACTDETVAADARALWELDFFSDIVFDAEPQGDSVSLTVRVTERPAVGQITFEGNDEVETSDLDERVTLRQGGVLSETEVREQVTGLRDLYAEKGFFLAQVTYELVPMQNNQVEVRFHIAEGDEVTVRRIRFVGNHHVPTDELLEIMQTSETGFFSFLSSSDTFNRDHFDEDVIRAQIIYYDRGYLAVRIGTPRVELTADRQHIDITIPVEEGPRFRIGRLQIREVDEGGDEVEPLEGRRELRERIEANPGDWFSRSSLVEDIQGITRAYRDRGYAFVEVTPQTNANPVSRRVDVVVAIERGPLVHIERINIRGNTKTRDLVIRRELEIAEGELYSQTRVEESKARVTALGYFERVDVSEEEGSAPDRIVLNFEVAERSTGTFQVGAGFSSLESFVFTAQVQQQNIFGRGQSLTLQLQLSGIRQLIQAQFVEPYLFDTEWTGSVEGFKTIRQFIDFNRDSTGFDVSLGHPLLDEDLRVFLEYRFENVDITSRTGPLFGSGGTGLDLFQRLPIANLYRDGVNSSLRLSLSWDSRDNRLFPTEGFYGSLSTEVADNFLGSENVFVRNRAFARFYHKIFGDFVLKLNTEWGLVTSRDPDGVPIYERYHLGGIFNVRGFRIYSLGPRIDTAATYDPNDAAVGAPRVIGGNMQLYYNLELEFPIIESVGIRGVVFTDGGNAWNLEDRICNAGHGGATDPTTDPCSVDPFALRTSWGFGLRWISPLGPLRFEWGLPFNPRPSEEDIVFEFTIGNFF